MYTNVFYFYRINSIGGIETFYYNLAKKYRDRDITIFYQQGAKDQIRRLAKFVRVIKWKGEEIHCKRAFFNFNLDIIDHVHAEEYYQIIHGDYKAMRIMPNRSPRIDRYLACSRQAAETFKEISGEDCKVIYNPADVDLQLSGRALQLISATRLTSEKGKNRMEKMAQLLDAAGVSYTWQVFTDDRRAIENPNIVYRTPCMDIGPHIKAADWLVQLSDNEGYCYSVVEALQLGVPVIVTPCPVFDELGVDDRNSIRLPFDFDEIPVKEILNGKKDRFVYKPKKDGWSEMLGKTQSTYALSDDANVRCIQKYFDIPLNRFVQKNEIVTFSRERAEYLADLGLVEIFS